MLNLFQHLTGKRSFTKDLCLSTSCDVGQMLKRVQHDVCLMLGHIVLSDNGGKQLNKLKNQETKNTTKNSRHPELVSGSIHFGMNGKGLHSVAKNLLNKQNNSLRCLLHRCRNSTHAAFDALQCQAPQGLTPLKLIPTRAFSLVETMIVLLIGTIALGMSAPMISKQIKHNDMNVVQFSVINREIEKVKSVVPKGVIVMWSGATVPTGWALCDGTNGTPDLRNRFIVGAGDEYNMGAVGGSKEVALTIAQMPNHNHGNMWWFSGYGANCPEKDRSPHTIATGAAHSSSCGATGFTGGKDGSTQAHENRPPYYALAYIMKTR